MKPRSVISLMVLAAFILLPQAALADDLADLKAAQQSYIQAWNTGDVETFMDLWLEGGLWLRAGSAFPTVVANIAGGKMRWSRWFETYTSRLRFYKPDYRVIGNTGLVWGHLQNLIRNKKTGVGTNNFRQFSFTWVKSEGKWKIAVFHITKMPQEIEIF